MQEALKAREAVKLQTLRLLLSAITNALVENRMKPTEKLDDDKVLDIIRRLVKQREESATQYRSCNDEERASAEDVEKKILEAYLPPEMEEEEVRKIVMKAKESLGVSEIKDQGILMREVMKDLKGRAKGSTISSIVKEVLS